MGHVFSLHSSTAKYGYLSDQVYERLRAAIISEELSPGTKLVELELASQMGTSQGPVREALQRLERDGLVEHRARSATFVTTISTDEMYELFSVRSQIEGFAIRRTIQKITPDQCTELNGLILKMEQAGSVRDMVSLAQYDMQFHRNLIEWSGSTGLLRAWTSLSSQIQRFLVQSHPVYFPDFAEVGTRHQPIVDALGRRDSEAAVKKVQENIMLIWPLVRQNPEGIKAANKE